jgi:hypothetical protein
MPRMIVLVEKDSNGKLWDYQFAREDFDDAHRSIGNKCPFTIHNACTEEDINKSPNAAPTTPSEEDFLTIGIIPQAEQINTFVKNKI